jgi:signal transduction histidine kinase
VRGDADRLAQVVLNLLDNAATHCAPDAGRVALGVHAAPEAVRLTVTDDGPGVAPHEQAAIFERFRQARRPGGPVGGSGLGLAIAERIVRLHDGQIGVESTPGEGATFWVTLPPAAPSGDGHAPGSDGHAPAADAPAADAPPASHASPPSEPV